MPETYLKQSAFSLEDESLPKQATVKELKQRTLFAEKHFIIQRNGVDYYKKNFETDSHEFISFADFEERKKSRKYAVKHPIIFFIGLGIILIGLLRASLLLDAHYSKSLLAGGLTISLGLFILLLYRLVQTNCFLIALEDDKRMFMLLNKPNQEDFENFLEAMYEARRRNYRENYFYVNEENDKRTELSRMKWLLNEDIITKEEYEDIVDEINLKFM